MPSVKKRPKKTEPRKALALALSSASAQSHLTLAWRPSPPAYKVQYVETDTSVSARFLGLARDVASKLATERTQIKYDTEWPLGQHEYFALTGDEIPGENLFDDLSDFLNLETFHKRSLTKPRVYTVAVQTPKGNALFGKRMAYLGVLNRKRGVFAAVWDGSTFSDLEASVATFSTTFDWVLWADTLYVLDSKNFHAEFRDNEAIKLAVADHVDTICQTIVIQGADELIERCQSSVPMASKLKHVVDTGIWREPVSTLKQYAIERGIDVVWDGDELVFDGSIERQFAILKLLAEDRTHGPVSGRTYDSAAKQEVSLGKRPASP